MSVAWDGEPFEVESLETHLWRQHELPRQRGVPDVLAALVARIDVWGVEGDGKCADCACRLGAFLHGDADQYVRWYTPWIVRRDGTLVVVCEDCTLVTCGWDRGPDPVSGCDEPPGPSGFCTEHAESVAALEAAGEGE